MRLLMRRQRLEPVERRRRRGADDRGGRRQHGASAR
eukprot:gene24878-32408_t